MKQDGVGRTWAWMATGAAVLAAGAFLGAVAGRRKYRTHSDQGWRVPEDLEDRPLARAALGDALVVSRHVERLSETVSGLETRLEAVENSVGGRVEAVWQRVLSLEERLEQIRTERVQVPPVETVVRQAEERLMPQVSALEARVEQHQTAIQQLQAQAAQTEANLQKMIAAVEKLTDQISRALPPAPLRIEPRKEAASSAPEVAPAEPRIPEAHPVAQRGGLFRWRSVGLIGVISFGLAGSYATIRQAEPPQTVPAAVASASVTTPDRLLETAIVSLESLAQREPENLNWKYELGRLNELKRDWAQAERWYRAVLEYDPHDRRATQALADLLSRAHR